MKTEKEVHHVIVEFAQTKLNANKFRQHYPITEEMKDELLTKILKDCIAYVTKHYYASHQIIFREYIDEHVIRGGKRSALENNLFWWQMIYNASLDQEMSCIEDYITTHYKVFCKKPLMVSWLREWEKATPAFYYVEAQHHNHSLLLIDMRTKKPVDVILYDPLASLPIQGEVVMGTLIPIGQRLYFPVVNFYHFDLGASKYIMRHFDYYYQKHIKKGTVLEVFIHVLSIILQVEKLMEKEDYNPIL